MSREPVDRPAPGPLELVRSFVNTRNLDTGTDALPHARAAAEWLENAGLLSTASRVSARDHLRIVSVREALRAILVRHAAGTRADDAELILNRLAADADLALRLSDPGMIIHASGRRPIDSALGQLLIICFDAIAEGTWIRLKACPAETCNWAYFDTSRNRSSRWCDMGLCGNRAKGETFKRRMRTRATAAERGGDPRRE